MIRPVLKAHIIAIAMLLLSVGALSQPIMGTRQLNLYTSDGLQSLSLQVAEPFTTSYTLRLPQAPTAGNALMLVVGSTGTTYQSAFQSFSTTPGDVLVIGSSSASWGQPFWSLQGNTFVPSPATVNLGATPGTTARWIGTNTATDLRIGTNNIIRAIVSSDGFFSTQNDMFVNATGSGGNGVRIGRGATIDAALTTENLALGEGALRLNTTGNANTMIGFSAGSANTTGTGNTALGSQALRSITTGSNNTAIGIGTLVTCTTCSGSTAIGAYALNQNTGLNNTAVGAWAMSALGAGSANTAVGMEALNAVTTGSNNVAFGYRAGAATTTGSRNVFIGPTAGASITGSSSDRFILAGTTVASGQRNPLLAGDFVTSRLWIGAQVLEPPTPGGVLHVVSPSANTRPLVIRAASGQISDLMQAETNTGRVLFSINATGGMDFRPVPTTDGTQDVREFRMYDLQGKYIAFKAPNEITDATNRVWTLPGTIGAQGDYLSSNAAGKLEWVGQFVYPPYVYNLSNSVVANSGTTTETPETFILGSVPEQPLLSGQVDDAHNNTGFGWGVFSNLTRADDNTAIGHNAMKQVSGTPGVSGATGSGGSRNVAIGKSALESATGSTATQANENVAVGTRALLTLTDGSNNVAVGSSAGSLVTNTAFLVAVGDGAFRNLIGNSNTAVGNRALEGVASAFVAVSNVAVGDNALSNLSSAGATSGIQTTAIGSNAGRGM
ncbi:MAG: beta strand repeat-containing protein, partial [Bacteroidota bacterium]